MGTHGLVLLEEVIGLDSGLNDDSPKISQPNPLEPTDANLYGRKVLTGFRLRILRGGDAFGLSK